MPRFVNNDLMKRDRARIMRLRARTKQKPSYIETLSKAIRGGLRCAVLLLGASLLACTPQITHHGHVFTESDLQQVQPGMSKDQVKLAFGTPDTTATVGGGAYYYISSKQKIVPLRQPRVVDRKIVAVYFDGSDSVTRIANYGLKDGKVFDFIKRETPSHGQSDGLISQLFRNLGQTGNLFEGGY